jgi:diguanylate cyclase (GGDEF)-like protein
MFRTPARPELRALALLVLGAGAACGFSAAFPPAAQTPRTLLVALAGLSAAFALVLVVAGRAVSTRTTVGAMAVMAILVSVVVGSSSTSGGAMLAGYAYVWMTVYIGLFLPRWAMRLHAALVAAGFGAGLLASGLPGMLAAWALVSATVWVFGHALVSLAGRARHHAETDVVTGLLNRRAFFGAAEREHELAARTGADLSLVLIDLDDFKAVNDRDGHAAGDRLLAELSAAWREALRPADVLARHGGDEFAILLPATSEEGAIRLVGRLRHAHATTWSAGVAAWPQGESLDGALARADARLYEAKRTLRGHAAAQPRATPATAPRTAGRGA